MIVVATISFTVSGLTAFLTHPAGLAVAAVLWAAKAAIGLGLWRHWQRRRQPR